MSLLFHMDVVAFCYILLNNYLNLTLNVDFRPVSMSRLKFLFMASNFLQDLVWWWIHPVRRLVVVPHSCSCGLNH
jgi:hypothetical protein